MGTTPINAIDLINLSKDIAQLNLGYLGISVVILSLLGGVFIYFNIKPLKDTLDKQEKTIDNLREQADQLLDKSKEQSEKALTDFKKEQATILSGTLKDQGDRIKLENENGTAELESSFSEKLETITENKNNKLKELIFSEMTNRITTLEKILLKEIEILKESLQKKILETSKEISDLKTEGVDLKRDIKELNVYKYSQEGKVGAIILSIELLREDIDDGRNDWRIVHRLEVLRDNIKGYALDPNYIMQIEEQLARIEEEKKYNILIKEVRDQYSEK